MTTPLHWSDAERARDGFEGRGSERRLLWLLAQLPLVDARTLQRLYDLQGPASVYRTLARLYDAGLIQEIRPPIYPGPSTRLYYLTDLGLATLALVRKLDPFDLVTRLHLRGSDLLGLLPSLPQLVALYELLGLLAASGPGWPRLLAWYRPWRCRYQPQTAKTAVSFSLPAYAAFAWGHETGRFFLLPDLGDLPLRVFRPALDHLHAFRKAEYLGENLPTLLIAAPGRGRVAAWWEFLEEVREARWDYPLPAYVAAWEDLPTDDERLLTQSKQLRTEELQRTFRIDPLRPRRPSSPLPRPVDDALQPSGRPHAATCLEHVALELVPSDRELLALVGSHPFLPPQPMATVLNWQGSRVRKHRRRLIDRGLMRLVGTDEIGKDAALELGELTVAGMELLAAGQGLSLTRAILHHGLTGGGLEEPIGARCALLTNLAHTLGCDALFVGLYRVAEQLRACGTDDAILEWQNGTACSRRHLRPDGYGRYYRQGYVYDFYLEYDRGTMSSKDYHHKLQAYYAYWHGLRLYRKQERFPIVLFVTVSDIAEERIARAARSAARDQYAPLPILLTCQWRIDEEVNRPGLLGPIWREPDADVDDRYYWIPPCLDRASQDRALVRPRPRADRRTPA